MPTNRSRERVADTPCATVASSGLRVKLVVREDDQELRGLIERYEQLLCDWESLSHRALKALSDRSHRSREHFDAL